MGPTLSCLEAPPCTPVLLTVCRRSLLPQRGSTPSGSEDPFSPLSPPSSGCGSPSRSTMSAAPPSSTGSASKLLQLFVITFILQQISFCYFHQIGFYTKY